MSTKKTALVILPSVLFRSGQLLDIQGITKNAHNKEHPSTNSEQTC